MVPSHLALGEKIATASQRMPSGLLPVRRLPRGMFDGLDSNAFLISADTKCLLSQNCCTRLSESRPRVLVSGDRMSVRNTGSQTTRSEEHTSELQSRQYL